MTSCVLDCDFEDDLLEDELIENQNFSLFYEKINLLISKNIKSYFSDKKLKNGGDINKSIYKCEHYIDMLFRTHMSDAILIAYRNMQEYNIKDNDEDEIRYVLKIIKNIQKHVPQDFVGGMLLMHLELIEGIEICFYES
jgi:hypothetical protein